MYFAQILLKAYKYAYSLILTVMAASSSEIQEHS